MIWFKRVVSVKFRNCGKNCNNGINKSKPGVYKTLGPHTGGSGATPRTYFEGESPQLDKYC
jgi:hypothetical protein